MGARVVVATTKFVVPKIADGVIARPKLIEQLNGSLGCRMVLVAAPPGSGKTTLLAEWVRQLTCPVAWLSCDATDADGRRFWRSMTMGLRRTWPTVGLDADEFLDDGNHRDLAISLANDLGEVEQPGVVVLDDFHLAHPDAAAMSAFIRSLPHSTTLVIGTRSDPPFALGRLRVQGQLRELRQQDLRLEQEEVDRFFDHDGVDLSPEELAQLAELTEGWIAGAVLARLYLQNKGSPGDLLRGLVATDRSMVDFLVNEVLDGLPDDIVEFLLTTAELETFDVALCDAVGNQHSSAELLRAVQDRNLFLVELDQEAGSYRYHHLFGRFLQARLRSMSPQRATAVHLAAAEAYAARGDAMSAVRHSLAASDVHGALRRLNAYHASSASPDDTELATTTARTWLRDYGEAHLLTDPVVIVNCLLILNSTSAPGVDLLWWLLQLQANEEHYDADARCLLHAMWSFYFLHRGEPDRMLAEAQLGEAIRVEQGVTNPWSHLLLHLLVQAHIWLDDLEAAEHELRSASSGRPRPPISDLRVPAFGSYVAFLSGELDVAEQRAAEAYAAAEQLGVHDRNTGLAEPALTMAGLALERGQLDGAETSLEQLLQIVEGGRRPQLELLGHLVSAQVQAARGDDVAVAVWLERARAILPAAAAPVRARVDQVEARLAIERGDLAAADAACARLAPSPRSQLLQARIALAHDEPALALTTLDGPAKAWATRRLHVERGVLESLALARLRRDEAHDRLRETLTLAEPVGFVWSIIGEGSPMWQLLESLPAGGRLASYVSRLLESAYGTTVMARPEGHGDLVEQLSEREITVLRYLSSRLPAPDIASTLYISGNTVRSHVKAIYRKLGVNSRAEAVERGRALGLLSV